MRVVHLISGLGNGGAETALARLCGDSHCKASHVMVVSLSRDTHHADTLKDAGIDVTVLGLGRDSTIEDICHAFQDLRKILIDQRPDILHCWMYHAMIVGGCVVRLTKRLRGLKVAWAVRQGLHEPKTDKSSTRFVIWICGKLSRWLSDGIAYNSNSGQQQHENIGYSAACVEVIPNGFAVGRIKFSSHNREKLRAKLSLSNDEIVVGAVGRRHPVKGYNFLIQAFASLAFENPQLRLLLIGKGLSLDNMELAKRLKEEGLSEDRVILLGERTDVIEWLSTIDIFILPSLSEGFPNALGEAMACERFCLGSSVGEVANMLGNDSYLFEPGDEKDIQRVLGRWLGAEAKERERVGNALGERIRERYRSEIVCERYDLFYLNVISM